VPIDFNCLTCFLNMFKVDAHAIYVRNLPLNATPQQLEEEFKRFGTIKYEGIQVRSNKVLFSSRIF
jgi:RNA recognition motif-containing protein